MHLATSHSLKRSRQSVTSMLDNGSNGGGGGLVLVVGMVVVMVWYTVTQSNQNIDITKTGVDMVVISPLFDQSSRQPGRCA